MVKGDDNIKMRVIIEYLKEIFDASTETKRY